MLKRGMKPSHPGALIKEMIIGLNEESGTHHTLGDIADGIGTTRKTLSFIINERQGVSTEMAIRLSEPFSNSARFWLDR